MMTGCILMTIRIQVMKDAIEGSDNWHVGTYVLEMISGGIPARGGPQGLRGLPGLGDRREINPRHCASVAMVLVFLLAV